MESLNFQFQVMMQTVINGMAGKMIPAIQTVSYVIMIISLMLGIYEAYAKGGDTKALAASAMKYIVVAFIVGNWTTFFTDLMNGFNSIAYYIDNSYGAGDLLKDWQAALSTNWDRSGYTSMWNMLASGGAAMVNSLEIAIAYLVFPIAVQVFTLVYIFWGAVVYTVGPLVLALAPSRMINGTAKFYAHNLFVWNCWAVVYAVFSCLIVAVNGKDITTSPFFSASIPGAQTQVWIGLTSILYAICIMLIPIIAMVVLKGEFSGVSSAFMTLLSAGNQASHLAKSVAGKGGATAARSATPNQGGDGSGAYSKASTPPAATPQRQVVP